MTKIYCLRNVTKHWVIPCLMFILSACGGGGGGGATNDTSPTVSTSSSSKISPSSTSSSPVISKPESPVVSPSADGNQLTLKWATVTNATYYQVLKNTDGHSGYSQLTSDLKTTSYSDAIPPTLVDWVNVQYLVSACNVSGCTDSAVIYGYDAKKTNPITRLQIDAFVSAHNTARASTSITPQPNPALPPVIWDPLLAEVAYSYLSKCSTLLGQQVIAINQNRTEDYSAIGGQDYVGENIFASSAIKITAHDAVTSWMSEQNQYDYATNSGSAGHFTQTVWRTSTRIGCAMVNCPGFTFSNTVLCNYAPGGNVGGMKPY